MSMPTASRAVVERGGARLLGAVLDRRRRRRAGPRAAALRPTTSCSNSAGLGEPAAQADGALFERAVEPADRYREVLGLQRLHDLADRDAGALQRVGVELDGELALDAADDVDLATPGSARSSRVMPGSASWVSSTGCSVVRRQRQRDDREVGAGRTATASAPPSRAAGRRATREILSRMSCVACWMSFSNTNWTSITA